MIEGGRTTRSGHRRGVQDQGGSSRVTSAHVVFVKSASFDEPLRLAVAPGAEGRRCRCSMSRSTKVMRCEHRRSS